MPPKVETIPAKRPNIKHAVGFVASPLEAPTITPPAREELRISDILNFLLKSAEMIKVE